MPKIELSEVMEELPIIAACIGRVSLDSANYVDLLARLIDSMTTAEKERYRYLYTHLQFSKRGDPRAV